MKPILSLLFITCSSLMRFCSKDDGPDTPQGNFIIRTVDGFGKPVKSTITYEFVDCEYDFSTPSTINSNNHGITVLNVPDSYIQFYANGFVHESYHCFDPNNRPDTITIYAAPIPTYVQTTPYAVVTWFSNTSGNCNYENTTGTTVTANAQGKAIIYLPQEDTYKIQVGTQTQCFQPDQEIHTLQF